VDEAIGRLCVRCGEQLLANQAVQLDHRDDGNGYLGYSHRSCNARAGAVAGNKARAAAYRAAKGLPPSANGAVGAYTRRTEPMPAADRCKRTHDELGAAAKARRPLPCICERRSSRCW
jgi:hypothetical protein